MINLGTGTLIINHWVSEYAVFIADQNNTTRFTSFAVICSRFGLTSGRDQPAWSWWQKFSFGIYLAIMCPLQFHPSSYFHEPGPSSPWSGIEQHRYQPRLAGEPFVYNHLDLKTHLLNLVLQKNYCNTAWGYPNKTWKGEDTIMQKRFRALPPNLLFAKFSSDRINNFKVIHDGGR